MVLLLILKILETLEQLPPYHKGRTCTHEVGHWLNLIHIWGDMTCGDDFVNDTPEQESPNYGCPAHPSPSCSNNGDMFQNYMDYTNDACMNMFTIGQKTRMQATLATARQNSFFNGLSYSIRRYWHHKN